MALNRPGPADKIIVDRRKAHRNAETARTVRQTRDRLSQQGGSASHDREILKIHARAVLGAGAAMPLLIMAMLGIMLMLGFFHEALAWAGIALACHGGLIFIAYRVHKTEIAALDPSRVRQILLTAHFLSGLGWAYLGAMECAACETSQFPVIKAAMLLAAMAVTALTASALSGTLLATFALPLALFALLGADLAAVSEWVMLLLLLAALPFLSVVARQLHGNTLMLLSFKGEKDALIAELETASAMSEEARRRAEEANLAKSRFLASMSHELRTPLNAILGFSEVMSSEVLGPMQNETYRQYSRDIHDSGQHLLDLINEILDLSRVEAGRYQLNEEPVHLRDVVQDCCRLIEVKAANKSIKLVRQFEQAMPRLFADERAVRQITLNLLSNALKFSPSGSEVIIRVGWTTGGGQYLSVTDNGPGIPPDEIPVVLSAFGQGSIAIKSAEQGTGLGLPIVQGLLSVHGGEFELHSRLREGTEAVAIFPPSRVMEELPALPTAANAGRKR